MSNPQAGTAWLVCLEPVHIGGADSSSRGNNNPVFRLPDRSPAIPGSSLRSALRERAEQNSDMAGRVKNWFGGQNADDDNISPGAIAVSWGWPVWWPVHVLGYGNWWVSCPAWLNRFQQLSGGPALNLSQDIWVTDNALEGKTVYLRWLKLAKVKHYAPGDLPTPGDQFPANRLIVVPDDSINLIVDMGLVRQPRVSLKDEADDDGNLVENLFAVEGFPPGATFLINWTTRGQVEAVDDWQGFLHAEHYLGGLWGVGYGRIAISAV